MPADPTNRARVFPSEDPVDVLAASWHSTAISSNASDPAVVAKLRDKLLADREVLIRDLGYPGMALLRRK